MLTDPTDTALSRVTAAVQAAAPVAGVSVSPGDPAPVVRVDYAPEATPEQIAAAAAAVAGFDWSAEADAAWAVAQFRSSASAALTERGDEIGVAIRAILRVVHAGLNQIRSHVGIPTVTWEEAQARIDQAIAAGLADPEAGGPPG